MSEQAKILVRKYWIKLILFLVVSSGILAWFSWDPLYWYTIDWPWSAYNYYIFLNLLAMTVLEIPMGVVYILQAKRNVNTMNEECDPYLFEECWQKMKPEHLFKNIYHHNCSVAKFHQGKIEEAWEHVNKIKPARLRGMTKYVYYKMKADLCFASDMIHELKSVENEFQQRIRGKKDEEVFKHICANNNMYRAYLNKDYEAAYCFMEESKEYRGAIHYMMQKVFYAYWTGLIDKEVGNLISAKVHFEFVVKNGNRMACVETAKAYLEELNEKTEF